MNCPSCNTDLTRDRIYRVNGVPKCGNCRAELEISFTEGSYRAQPFSPVVIHRDAQGNIRFPASPDAPLPEGFLKEELRTTAEVRSFEREVNQRERAEWDANQTRKDRAFDEQRHGLRSDLQAAMRHMTPFGRDFARLAMQRTDERRRGSYDAGFHVDVFSNDSGNREGHCDESTGWKRRKS